MIERLSIGSHAICTWLLCITLALPTLQVNACTRALWSEPGMDTYVGRTQDWFELAHTKFRVFPKGIKRNGLTGDNSLNWVSKYGSLVLTGYDLGTHEGMNEKGLSGHMLYLKESNFGTLDSSKPSISMSLWVQYFLDNFSSVNEAVEFMEKQPFQVVPTLLAKDHRLPLHLSLEDKNGDSAIIEFIDGEAKIYHDKKFTILTNSPTFDQHLQKRSAYLGYGGKSPLPGTRQSTDRFVRASHYIDQMAKADSEIDAVANLLATMRNVSVPVSKNVKSITQWRTISNLSKGIYYFDSPHRLNLVSVNMADFDLSIGSSEMLFDPERGPALTGNVNHSFAPAKPFEFKTHR